MKLEEKTFPFEVKAITEDGQFEGYAAIFDKPDALNEVIEKGAFTKTLKEKSQVPMCWYHDPRDPIGIADVSIDEKGLKVDGHLNLEVQSAREKHALMKQKAIRGLSFGFNTVKDQWEGNIRRLLEVKLFEISPCTFQAHPKALISAVKQQPWEEQKPFPNEHSARLKDPGLFSDETFRRKADGTIYGKIKVPSTIDVIWGKLKGSDDPDDNPIPQALRFPTKDWTAAEAKKWLADNNVKYQSFEAASKSLEGVLEFLKGTEITESKSGRMISTANLKLINNAVEALVGILKKLEPSDDTQDDKKSLIPESIGRFGQDEEPRPHSQYLEEIEIPKS